MSGLSKMLHTVLCKIKKYYYIRNRMTNFFPCLVLFYTVFVGLYIYIVSVILPECFSKLHEVYATSSRVTEGTTSLIPEYSGFRWGAE